jgi:hypothetical protein
MIKIKTLLPELADAPPMLLMVCCPTVKELLEYTAVCCPTLKRKHKFADAWGYLQIWFCKHPQNVKFN